MGSRAGRHGTPVAKSPALESSWLSNLNGHFSPEKLAPPSSFRAGDKAYHPLHFELYRENKGRGLNSLKEPSATELEEGPAALLF